MTGAGGQSLAYFVYVVGKSLSNLVEWQLQDENIFCAKRVRNEANSTHYFIQQ